MTRAELGRIGEDIATEYLIEKGFTIIERNYNLHHGCEIDIIARKGMHIHYVEVKTRRFQADIEIEPQEAITYKKLVNINRARISFERANRLWNVSYQIDSIAVTYKDSENYEVNMYEDISNVFYN